MSILPRVVDRFYGGSNQLAGRFIVLGRYDCPTYILEDPETGKTFAWAAHLCKEPDMDQQTEFLYSLVLNHD